jgi:hypothetical protein
VAARLPHGFQAAALALARVEAEDECFEHDRYCNVYATGEQSCVAEKQRAKAPGKRLTTATKVVWLAAG